MPVIVSLLRGINVGGKHQVKMDALREVFEALGLRDVQTFIQSGNVVCNAAERQLPRLRQRLEDAIEARFGFRCDVVVRTAEEMRSCLFRNPFRGRTGIESAKLLITFLAQDPDPDGCSKLRSLKLDPEELHIVGRDVYVYFPTGMGRSKLSWPLIAKSLKTSGTGRNLNTVEKLIAMADRLEAVR